MTIVGWTTLHPSTAYQPVVDKNSVVHPTTLKNVATASI